MVVKKEGELLKDKKPKGKIIKDSINGELLKDKVLEGEPLWKKKKKLNETNDEEQNLNESV